MHFQYVVAPPTFAFQAPPQLPPVELEQSLLRELIEVQREQLAYLRAAHEAQHSSGRWLAFFKRWSEEFPSAGQDCLKAFPHIERAFLRLVDDLSRRLTDDEEDSSIDDEFSLGEFLDRYGMRLAQLGNVLNILGPLAEAARISKKAE